MKQLYTSELAAQGMNLAPKGTPHTGEATCCAMCSRPILPGDISAPLDPSQSFTDWMSLTPSEHLCGWCEVTSQQVNLRALQRSVITKDGIYPIGEDAHRAWFLLTPPEPPYAVVVSNSQITYHLHWTVPVTLSNDLVVARVDDRIVTIRRAVLMQALEDCQEAASLLHAYTAATKKSRKPPRNTAHHPFVFLDRSLTNPSHGALRPGLEEALAHRPDLLSRLSQLSVGELWALATLLKEKMPTPVKPELITSTPKPKPKDKNKGKGKGKGKSKAKSSGAADSTTPATSSAPSASSTN